MGIDATQQTSQQQVNVCFMYEQTGQLLGLKTVTLLETCILFLSFNPPAPLPYFSEFTKLQKQNYIKLGSELHRCY